MAKKKTDGPNPASPASAPRRRATSTRNTAARSGEAPVKTMSSPAVNEPIDLAADMSVGAGSSDSAAARDPSHDEIAEAAYQRYLERGGNHGNDWDDWYEAERSLRSRR